MAGLTQARAQAILDAEFVAGDHIAYSSDGSSETGVLGRTAVGAWAAATAATPSVKANSGALTSATASGSATITHFAIFSADTGGTQKTDWTALSASRAVVAGDTLQWAVGALQVTLD